MTTEKKGPDTLAEALREARVKRDALAAATDKLNEKITAAESAIGELRLGVRGEYAFEHDENSPWYKCIIFDKHERQWRLMWGSGNEERPEGFDEYGPLVQAPRSVRLRAVKSLPKLVMSMVASMDNEIKNVEQRTGDVDRFITELYDQSEKKSETLLGAAIGAPAYDEEPVLNPQQKKALQHAVALHWTAPKVPKGGSK